MSGLYAPSEPSAHGWLETSDGNEIYWETCGSPSGKPAIVLHGGPGSGCGPSWRRYFDPDRYRVVLFDQRGCGRSRPDASDPTVDLTTNTTQHLIADIEALREHLGIERWLVLGGSWGSTLGLAYAQRWTQRISELVLFSVVTTSEREVRWVTREIGRLFPAEWRAFRDGVPPAEREGNLAAAYARLLHDADPLVREKAARDWCRWEDAHVRLLTGAAPSPRYEDPIFRMGFARLVTHYWSHAAFLDDEELIRHASLLAATPGVMLHGRLDIGAPLDTPWRLHQAWPGSELVIVDDAGHGLYEAPMRDAVVAALDRFASA